MPKYLRQSPMIYRGPFWHVRALLPQRPVYPILSSMQGCLALPRAIKCTSLKVSCCTRYLLFRHFFSTPSISSNILQAILTRQSPRPRMRDIGQMLARGRDVRQTDNQRSRVEPFADRKTKKGRWRSRDEIQVSGTMTCLLFFPLPKFRRPCILPPKHHLYPKEYKD